VLLEVRDESLAFLGLVANAYPRRQLHVVVDNHATHKHAKVITGYGRPPQDAAKDSPLLAVRPAR